MRGIQIDLKTEIRRAEQARQILETEVFKSAVQEIETALLFGMRKSAFSDEKLREKTCQRYALLHDLLDCLKSTMETGKLARIELERKNNFFNKIGIVK